MYELALLAGNGYTQELTDYEKTELAARLKAALEAARDAGEITIEGRVRDLVGEILGEKPTNMARIEKINNNAEPEIKEQFKEGKIGISAAYEAAKLPPEEQQAIAARAAAGENVKTKEIAKKVAEKIAAKAQDKADKAAEDAEKAEIDAQAAIADAADKQAQAEIEAENARELKRYVEDKANASNVSETDTESQLIVGLPENRDAWKNREWGIYTVRSLMYHVDIMDVDDVTELQGILFRLEARAKGEEPGREPQQEQIPGQMNINDILRFLDNPELTEGAKAMARKIRRNGENGLHTGNAKENREGDKAGSTAPGTEDNTGLHGSRTDNTAGNKYGN